MNPILYFDELDKVSQTPEGREIISILTHMVDPSQNTTFEDRYFAGVPLDLSRCIIVFSYNGASAIDPILLDRVQRISIGAMSVRDRCEVGRQFLLPSICREVGVVESEHAIPPDVLRHIIEHYTAEAGVRRLKELLFTIVRERNRQYLCDEMNMPIRVPDDVRPYLTDSRPSRIDRVGSCDDSAIGAVNALCASSMGGGVIPVQVVKVSPRAYNQAVESAKHAPHETTAGRVLLTGRQGEVMTQSAEVAVTVATLKAGDVRPPHFHLHCPDGGTRKDGPSAGCAFALAFLSVLTKRPVRQNLALTGEIDLLGKVLPIGGIGSKICGALLHGVEIILIPEENRRETERHLEHNPLPSTATIHYIATIDDAIGHALLESI